MQGARDDTSLSFCSLPQDFLRAVFLLVPVDTSLRCAGVDDAHPSFFVLFCADVRKHLSLMKLKIVDGFLNFPIDMGQLVDAAVALKLGTLHLYDCTCTPLMVPELTRLVSAGLTELIINNLFEVGQDTDQFCAVVRASACLERLEIHNAGPQHGVAAAATYINARRGTTDPRRSGTSTRG